MDRARLLPLVLALSVTTPVLASEPGSTAGPDDGSRHHPPVARAAAAPDPVVKGACPLTVLVDSDNEDNAGTGVGDGDMGAGICVFNTDPFHPIEWNMPVAGPLPTTSASLVLRAFDVDDDEIDTVTFNGTAIGVLTGANDATSTVVLDVPIALVVVGNNRVAISVVETGAFPRCVEIVETQLLLDGGCPATASCRSITTDGTSFPLGGTVNGTVEVDTSLASQTVRLEANLVDPGGNIQTTTAGVATITAADDPLPGVLPIPPTGPAGTYTVQAFVFDGASGVLQDSCSTTVGVTGGGFSPAVPGLSGVGLALLAGLLGAAGWKVLRR